MIAFCRERLAHYKCPRTVDVVDALPRDPNGKLQKRELRDRYWAGRERTHLTAEPCAASRSWRVAKSDLTLGTPRSELPSWRSRSSRAAVEASGLDRA